MDRKRYLLLGGIIGIFVLAITLTYALIYYRSETTGVNLTNDTNIGQYINYENGTPILSSANATLDAGEDYTSGLSTDIEFWKTTNAHNMVIYGHILLDVNTGSSALLSNPGLKWAVVSNNTVLAQGNFTAYNQGDSIPMYVNFALSSTETHFQIYVWLDINTAVGDIKNETLKVTVRCEATTEQYSATYLQRLNADVINISYTGSIDTYMVPRNGTYKLEVWGAQGGDATYAEENNTGANNGGKGGYSVATINLNAGDTLYTVVGAAGQSISYDSAVDGNCGTVDNSNGYNGGGYASAEQIEFFGAGGGGATHIATKSGLLKDLSDSPSSVLIVAGGGGGAAISKSLNDSDGHGGYGGGAVGGDGQTVTDSFYYCYGYGGTQTDAGSYDSGTGGMSYPHLGAAYRPNEAGFGLGGNFDSFKCSENKSYAYAYQTAGGGSGYYGGHAGYRGPGGGGSSYVGNLTGGKMYCYNCTEDTGNKTYTATSASENPEANTAKIGNGYARITRIS